MVKIGWLADDVGMVGGAELSGATLVNHAPKWAEIVFCPRNRKPDPDIDVFVLQNVFTYEARWIDALEEKTLIKHFRDPWHPGDIAFRRFVLDTAAAFIFNSPPAFDHCPWDIARARAYFVPPPVDLDTFRAAARPQEERHGNVYLGRVDMVKGIHRALDWALVHCEPLDVYGPINTVPPSVPGGVSFHGPVGYAAVPSILGAAKRFVFLPGAEESYSRTTIEAWAAGCEMVTDKRLIGAWWWLENSADALEGDRPVTAFWNTIAEYV